MNYSDNRQKTEGIVYAIMHKKKTDRENPLTFKN